MEPTWQLKIDKTMLTYMHILDPTYNGLSKRKRKSYMTCRKECVSLQNQVKYSEQKR